jgi:2-oxoglutarate ferredoxin oxidoreductase subunit delta
MIKVEEKRCKSCGICMKFCPQQIIVPTDRINIKGYHVVGLKEAETCTGCGICALVCPDAAIAVYK